MTKNGIFIFIKRYNDKYHFWNNVYGFKMSVMKNNLTRDAQVDYADSTTIISDPFIIADINTETATAADLDFTSSFELEIKKDSTLNAFCGWFDIGFDINESHSPSIGTPIKVNFSTSCFRKNTHWKQVLFVLAAPINVSRGDLVGGVFKCKKSSLYKRELLVEIEWSINSGDIVKQIFNVR